MKGAGHRGGGGGGGTQKQKVSKFLRHFSPLKANSSHKQQHSPPRLIREASPCSLEEDSIDSSSLRLGIGPTQYSVPKDYIGSPPTNFPVEKEVVYFQEGKKPDLLLNTWEQEQDQDCNNTSLDSSAGSTSLTMSPGRKALWGNKKDDTKRKAQDIVMKSRSGSKSASSGTLSSSSSTSSVTIFLLLLEPTSKAFELIQLIYPRKNTKICDLLKMIPQNATEPVLADQHYTGITRPKRRSEPVSDLQMLASHSVSATSETAGFSNGEIIVAVPANASSATIIGLAKQILANTRIQKLLSQKHKRKKRHKSSVSATTTSSLATVKTTKVSTGRKVAPSPQPTAPPRQKAKSFQDYCQEEMKRTVKKEINFSVEPERNPCDTETPEAKPAEPVEYPSTPAAAPAVDVDFPKDLLDAYLSKEALMRMCEKRSVDRTDSLTDDDDSLTSSFHSWRFSLDGSMSSKVTLLQSPVAPLTHHRVRKRHYKLMKRVGALVFVASVARYRMVVHTGDAVAAADFLAANLGWTGMVQFACCFGALTQLQKVWEHPECLLQVASQLYETVVAATNSQNGVPTTASSPDNSMPRLDLR